MIFSMWFSVSNKNDVKQNRSHPPMHFAALQQFTKLKGSCLIQTTASSPLNASVSFDWKLRHQAIKSSENPNIYWDSPRWTLSNLLEPAISDRDGERPTGQVGEYHAKTCLAVCSSLNTICLSFPENTKSALLWYCDSPCGFVFW